MFARKIEKTEIKQPLIEHLEGVATKSRERLPEFLKELGYYGGLLHDLGKAKKCWQKYLLEGGSTVFHSSEGARAVYELTGEDETHPLVYIIRSHHGKLKNSAVDRDFFEHSKHWDKCLKRLFPELTNLPNITLNPYQKELAIRMLFSVLVDSDRLDAMEFESKYQNSQKQEVQVKSSLFQFAILPRSQNQSKIVKERENFRSLVIQYATSSQDIYRLIGVTGIGKTLTSLQFAVEHCHHHNMDGILYIAPFKSILDQSAKVYRDVLGDEVVLEHHSDFIPKQGEEIAYRLSSQRWDSPVIVTTAIQFFESLFSNQASRCRKLAGIMNRVILIDEYQTIPPEFLPAIANVLNELVINYGCSVVLMSATAPNLKGFELPHIDMIPQEQLVNQFKTLSRCSYQFIIKNLSWEDISAIPQKKLVIVNTTKTAQEAFKILNQQQLGQWVHLSSRMCVAHRKRVINQIKSSDINCVSTQIIEAGIDIDYPIVLSEECPLDSLIQRGGRCNREGLLDNGEVLILNCDNFPDPIYQSLAKFSSELIKKYGLNSENYLSLLKDYFAQKNKQTGQDEIQRLRLNLQFESVAEKFSFINKKQLSAVCRWGDGADIIDHLKTKEKPSLSDWKKLQQYTATIPQKWKDLIKVFPNGLSVWDGQYSDDFGIFY